HAPDRLTKALNCGASSAVDVQFAGPIRNQADTARLARELLAELRSRPGISDLHSQQVTSVPDLRVDVDRTLAGQLGLTQRDVAQDLLVTLSGTLQAAPNFWLSPQNGVTYSVIVQAPQRRIDSLQSLETLPVVAPDAGAGVPQVLGNLATTGRGLSFANITHYSINRTVDVLMNVSGTDLGRAGNQVREVVDRYKDQLPRGSTLMLRGQVESMRTSFEGLLGGLL